MASKKRCGSMVKTAPDCEKSGLETLPQHVLVTVLCGLEHEDLRQLFHVSKKIREATIIAKQLHFNYCTPKKVPAFGSPLDLGDFEEGRTSNAQPKRDLFKQMEAAI